MIYFHGSLFSRDLYGAVGFPLKVARTIVVGKDSTLVDQVLNILSYFIRCSEVFEHDQKREDGALEKGNGNSHDISGASICLHCGSSNLTGVNLAKTDCASHESETCLKCKQNFEELLQDDMKDVVECSVDGDVLKRLQSKGLTFCAKCDSKIHGSAMERMLCCDDLQLSCKFHHVPNGVVRMDKKHLIKNVNLVRKTTHTENTFQCYCCKDLTDFHDTLVNERTFKCYCSTDGTFHKIMETDSEMLKLAKEHNCNNLIEKSNNYQLCEGNCVSAVIDTCAQNVLHNGNQDLSAGALECTDICISKTDDCISYEMDIDSVSSVPEKIDSEETVASYGRSGSADSGIYQSPLNSPVVGHSVDFLDAANDQFEDEQMPEELPLPR